MSANQHDHDVKDERVEGGGDDHDDDDDDDEDADDYRISNSEPLADTSETCAIWREAAATQNVDPRAEMLVEERGGTQSANCSLGMLRKTYTVEQNILEEGGGTQNVNRSTEIRIHRHKARPVRRKYHVKRVHLPK